MNDDDILMQLEAMADLELNQAYRTGVLHGTLGMAVILPLLMWLF